LGDSAGGASPGNWKQNGPTGGTIARREYRVWGRREIDHTLNNPSTTATAIHTQIDGRRRGTRVGSATGEPDSRIRVNWRRSSPALCQRPSGFLARHFLTASCSAGGVFGSRAVIGVGSEFRIAPSAPAEPPPSNARAPVID